MTKICIIDGPNLNMVGIREPEIYGEKSVILYIEELKFKYSNVTLEYKQSNSESEIISFIHQCKQGYLGLIINTGAYTHTSLAIADAIRSVKLPVIEVHISNIYKRETFRRVSYISASCVGTICGFGLLSYKLAIEGLLESVAETYVVKG